MVLSLLINIMMAVLLIVTIVYCRRVNQRIQVLQDSRSELAQIIREFDESTERATKSIAEIHEATHRLSENMQHKIDKANFLVGDLQTMIDKGNRVAGIAEGAMRSSNPAPVTPPKSVRRGVESIAVNAPTSSGGSAMNISDEGEGSRRVRQRSRAEQEVLDALKNKGE
ncbi:MAG: DUF6468 domain-containing protein [Rickettsiales bacterium]